MLHCWMHGAAGKERKWGWPQDVEATGISHDPCAAWPFTGHELLLCWRDELQSPLCSANACCG